MPEPKDYKRKVFASRNGFNPNVRWDTTVAGKPGLLANLNETKGMCFAMTCNWIKLCVQHGLEGSARVMDVSHRLQAAIVQSGYLNLRRTFTGATSDAGSEAIVYQQYRLKPRFSVTGGTEAELAGQKFGEKLHQYGAKLMTAVGLVFFEVGVPRHSVGMALGPIGAYLYDPNYGLYEYDLHDGVEAVTDHLEGTYPRTDGGPFQYTFTAVSIK